MRWESGQLFRKNEFWITPSKDDFRSKILLFADETSNFRPCNFWFEMISYHISNMLPMDLSGIPRCNGFERNFYRKSVSGFVGVSGLARSFLRLLHSPCGKIRIKITVNNRYELLCVCFHCCLDIFLMNMNHESWIWTPLLFLTSLYWIWTLHMNLVANSFPIFWALCTAHCSSSCCLTDFW